MAKFSDNSMAAIMWDEVQITLGTPIAGASVSVASRIDTARLQGFRLLKTEILAAMTGVTPGEGPVALLMSHDLTATETEQTLGADPQRSNDPEASPRAMQPLWPVCVFEGGSGVGNGTWSWQGDIKLGWSFPEGTQLTWVVNNFSANTLTTGSVVHVLAKHFGVWLKD